MKNYKTADLDMCHDEVKAGQRIMIDGIVNTAFACPSNLCAIFKDLGEKDVWCSGIHKECLALPKCTNIIFVEDSDESTYPDA